MNKFVWVLAVSSYLTGGLAWAQDNTAMTPVTEALTPIATPKPLPPDVKAARDKWFAAKLQLIEAEHNYNTVKMAHEMQNTQKAVSDAQAKNDTKKAAKCQAKLTILEKVKTDQDQIYSLNKDKVASDLANDKADVTTDSDQIKALQDDMKAQWQSLK